MQIGAQSVPLSAARDRPRVPPPRARSAVTVILWLRDEISITFPSSSRWASFRASLVHPFGTVKAKASTGALLVGAVVDPAVAQII